MSHSFFLSLIIAVFTTFMFSACSKSDLTKQDNEPLFLFDPLKTASAKLCGPHSGIVDPGYPEGRADADFDGDGCLDYCRVVGITPWNAAVACTISFGPLNGKTIFSSEKPFDWGYKEGRGWIDINNDNRADYCRIVGGTNHVDSRIACSISLGDKFETSTVSNVIDWGYKEGRGWIDINNDNRADYCRIVGGPNHVASRIACSLGDKFETSTVSNVIDWGYPYHREYRDCNNDGVIDFCRAVGNIGYSYIACSPISYSNNVINVSDAISCKYNDPNRQKVTAECLCLNRNGSTLKSNKEMCSGYLGCSYYCYDLADRGEIDTSNGLQILYRETSDCPQ